MSGRGLQILVSVALAALLGACTQSPGPSELDGGPDLFDAGADAGVDCAVVIAAPDAPLRRLTRDEYDNTVRDLLGDASRPARAFPPDSEGLGFDNQAKSQDVSPALAEAWADAAEKLAASVAFTRIVPCDPTVVGQEVCARSFLKSFGRRAFRRPLLEDEEARMMALFTQAAEADGGSFETGVRFVVELMLQSPQFLYRLETGELGPDTSDAPEGDGRVPLTGYELATRLSYFLWASTPDDALLASAEAGELATRAGLELQARRMLGHPHARQMVQRFGVQWLGLSHFEDVAKDPLRHPDFADVRELMRTEAALFTEHMMLDGDGDASRLFVGRDTWVNDKLSAYYGLPLVNGAEFKKVPLFRTSRIGLLTLGAVTSQYAKVDQSSPVLRGKFIRERLLCEQLRQPPGDVVLSLAPPDTSTTRERYDAHSRNPACSGCHKLLEPVGFGLEHFDGAGRFRLMENGALVDVSGEVVNTKDLDGAFNGVEALAEKLARSTQVKECLAVQWFRFAMGRSERADVSDLCSLEQVQQSFKAAGYDVRELLVSIATSDAFRYRGRVLSSGGEP